MNQGTYPLAAAMINQISRLDVISNNLANVNTNGFKEEGLSEGTFNNYLKEARESNSSTMNESAAINNIPKIDQKYISFALGPIEMTGNKLDFALKDQNTFFKVQNANGEVMYTRDGSFKVLNNSLLVDGNGNFVLNNDNEAISTEDDFLGLIAVVKTEFTNLDKFGDNYYRVKDENQVEVQELNEGFFMQGAVEKSNVNMVNTMIGLIDASKSFAQSQKAITTIDEMNRSLIQKLGRMV